MVDQTKLGPKNWMKAVLVTAGIYHILWGFLSVIFPHLIFLMSGMDRLSQPFIWQFIGMINIVFGIGFLITSLRPFQYWPLVFLGFISKFFGILGFLYLASTGTLPWNIGVVTFFNEGIWLIPFGIMLYHTYRQPYFIDELLIDMYSSKNFDWEMFETNQGENLKEITDNSPTMVLFLRHFGCTFCREALKDISEKQKVLNKKGIKIVLVHMLEDENEADKILQNYGLEHIPLISDPECILYKMFKLKKGSATQLFGLKVWLRGLKAGVLSGHGLGGKKGETTQMPGVFLIYDGQILSAFVHKNASDRPCYESLVEDALTKINH